MIFLLSAALLLLFSSTTAVEYENVALQGVATQSSLYIEQTTAMKAIDGNTDMNFYHYSCSCTNAEPSPWWRVDLQKSYKISHITVTNRSDGSYERIDGANILIGDSLANNGNNNPSCAKVQYKPNVLVETYQCNGMTGRYVNINLPQKGTYLQLCEVQVYVEVNSLCF